MRRTLFILVLCFAQVANADQRSDARRRFRAGMALIAEGRVNDGIEELEEAYRILPHPNVLFNIAHAYEDAGNVEAAVAYYRRYLESDPTDRNDIEARITNLEGLRAPHTESTAEEPVVVETHPENLTADESPEPEASASTPATPPTPRAAADVPSALGMREDAYTESVVSATRSAQSPMDAPNSTAIISAQSLRLQGNVYPGFALRRVAGVEIMHTDPGNLQISIRGLNQRLANRTIVLIDGRSIYLDFLGTTMWPLLPIDAEDIERIEVIRGPTSAVYGADALTGAINIVTRRSGERRGYFNVGFGTGGQLRASTGVSGQEDRFRYRMSGGYERQNNYAYEVGIDRVDGGSVVLNPTLGTERLMYNGELVYRFDGGYFARLGASVAAGRMFLQGISRLRQLVLRDAFFGQSFAALETPFGLSLRVFWNRFVGNIGPNNQTPNAIGTTLSSRIYFSDVIDVELLEEAHFQLWDIQNTLTAGLNYRLKQVRWDWLAGTEQRQHLGAAFIEDALRFSDAVRLVLSVRADVHPLVPVQVSPRAALIVHPDPTQTVRVSAATAYRNPSYVESYLEVPNALANRGVTAFGLGNTRLSPERIASLEVGYMNQASELLHVEVNVFANAVWSQIQLSNASAYRLYDVESGSRLAQYNSEYQAYPVAALTFANSDDAFAQVGGEVSLESSPATGLDVYANYAYFRTLALSSSGRNPFANDARTSEHKVNAGLEYRSPWGFDFGVEWSWQSDQLWTEQVVDGALSGVAFQAYPLRSYTVLNARIGYRMFSDKVEIGVIGTNLLDDMHREHPFGQPIDRRALATLAIRF